MNIRIADLIFKINHEKYDDVDTEKFIDNYLSLEIKNYLCESDEYDCLINMYRGTEYIETGVHILSIPLYKVYKTDSGIRFVFLQNDYIRTDAYFATCSVDISYDLKTVSLIDYIDLNARLSKKYYVSLFVIIKLGIQNFLLNYSSFFLHGVALNHNDKNIIFSAASGVGKTTHTTFWKDKYDVEILNGDSPIVKIINNRTFIYGSPWCGSSSISVNKTVPLDAIVMIKRGETNKIRKLSKIEAMMHILPYIRRTPWEEKIVELCLQYSEMLANTVSVYELTCLPNEEAAEVALAGIEELHG